MFPHKSWMTSALILIALQFTARARAQEQDIPIPDSSYEQAELEPPIEPADALPDRDPMPAPQLAAAPDATDPEPKPGQLFSGGGVALLGGIGPSTYAALGFHAGRVLFSVGLSVHFDPAGLNTGAGRALDTLALSLNGSVAIMAYNRAQLAFGPELAFATNITPGPAISGSTELQPGLALWYAPFRAPLLFGTALQLAIKFAKGSDPVIDTAYPGLRLRWGF